MTYSNYCHHSRTNLHCVRQEQIRFYNHEPYCISIDDEVKEYYIQNREYCAVGYEYMDSNFTTMNKEYRDNPIKKITRTIFCYSDATSPLALGIRKFVEVYERTIRPIEKELKDYTEIYNPNFYPTKNRYYLIPSSMKSDNSTIHTDRQLLQGETYVFNHNKWE
jgi:hypothetical protein